MRRTYVGVEEDDAGLGPLDPCPFDPCGADPVEPCVLELEPDPPELWLSPELLEELDPLEEPPWEPPPLDPPELPPLPDECCAKVRDESRKTAATQRLESRIKHLVPTDYSNPAGDAVVSWTCRPI